MFAKKTRGISRGQKLLDAGRKENVNFPRN
jgi:hypothetical protein